MDDEAYYKILGIELNSDFDLVKSAFKKLARKYHPDLNSGFEAKYKKIFEAYNFFKLKNKFNQSISDDNKLNTSIPLEPQSKSTDPILEKRCGKCKKKFPATKEYYGHTPTGKFRTTCRQCIRTKVKKHSEQNPELVQSRQKKRKSLERDDQGLKQYDRKKLLDQLLIKQKNLCYYCKQELHSSKKELDHKIPLAKGGLDIINNIVLACSICNKEKHNKNINEYRSWKQARGYNTLF
jgi:curved DNA-binding protein CbpA